jgi:hypothetical protein
MRPKVRDSPTRRIVPVPEGVVDLKLPRFVVAIISSAAMNVQKEFAVRNALVAGLAKRS